MRGAEGYPSRNPAYVDEICRSASPTSRPESSVINASVITTIVAAASIALCCVLASLIEGGERRPQFPAAGLVRLSRGAFQRDDEFARGRGPAPTHTPGRTPRRDTGFALAFILPSDTGDIACEDRVRRAVSDGLGDVPYSVWITVEFGYDAELFESRA
jgi:hypothetical protein